jgi:DNA replication and repair protein RecF
MEISKLRLTDFRNFSKKLIEFNPGVNVIMGPNGSGKTNILEALYLLSIGKSFKARVEGEMIRYEQQLARVTGVLSLDSPKSTREGSPALGLPVSHEPLNIEAVVTRGDNGWPKKRLLLNGVPKRTIDFAGNFKTVLFGPWDMDMVTGPPSLRRRFLDSVLSQTDREYRRSILSYEKGLRQRNKLLYRIREGMVSGEQLTFWNQLLIKNGDYITKKREEIIEYINSIKPLKFVKYSLEYNKSIISEGRLETYKNEEVAAATTLVGPHRDDFIFKIKDPKSEVRDLASFGSRGEQRMGILWLKMAELSFIESSSGERPTLLLDDIFSELDDNHREIVINVIDKQQTIITSADDNLTREFKKVERITLVG